MVIILDIGQIIYSINGSDSKRYYIVVDINDEYLFIVDGKRRTIEKPKKKKIKHIMIIDEANTRIKEYIKNNKLTNRECRKILKDYYSK